MTPLSHLADGLALIFDMDGVIVHSTPLHNQAWQEYLRRHGIEQSMETIETKMLGKHNDAIVRIFFGDDLPAAVVARHGAQKEKLFREIMAPRLQEFLVPGVCEFVRAHAGGPIAVATNAEAANVSFVLKGAGLEPYFQVVIDGHKVDKPKPDPEIYVATAQRLGIPPADCIVLEDSFTGVAAARAAGMRVVGLLTTAPHLDDCDLTITDFLDPELEAWLQQSRPAAP